MSKTQERSSVVTSRILALHRLGMTVPQIAKELDLHRRTIERALHGLQAFRLIDNSYLQGLPTISDEAAAEMGCQRTNGCPSDEEKTTDEIYAAAAAIREKRPRMPVGYQVFAVEMEATAFMGVERRGRSVA